MHNVRFALVCSAIAIPTLACGAQRSDGGAASTEDAQPVVDSGADARSDSGASFDVGGSNDVGLSVDGGLEGGISDECMIFAVGPNSAGTTRLARFDPIKTAVSVVADIDFSTAGGGGPFSMAVDRHGTAWVLMSGDPAFAIFEVDVHTGAFKRSSFVASSTPPFRNFGMAFTKIPTPSAEETLFVTSEELATIDVATSKLTPIGPTGGYPEGGPNVADLSGSADGRLWAFYPTYTPPYYTPTYHVSALDEKTGEHVGPTMNPTIAFDPTKPVNSWAFSFWGGVFWLFVGPELFRYDPATDATTVVMHDVGLMVWGAGASTCAPVEIPK